MNVKSGKVHVIIAAAAFILTLAMLVFVAFPIQLRFGMVGLAATEVIILAIAVVSALLSKRSFAEIFPFSAPKPRQVAGTVILWIASYVSVLLASLLSAYFFPDMLKVSEEMTGFFNSVPLIITVLVAAFLPAFCEEALHRGLIFSSLDIMKKGWLRVLIMGLVFGVFHLNAYRFLPTAMLGAMLSYIMLRTNNLWLPVLLHFINNLVSTVAGSFSSGEVAATQISPNDMMLSIASFMIISAAVPFLLLLGNKLISVPSDTSVVQAGDGIAENPKKVRPSLICAVASAILLVTGILLIVLNN